MWYPSSMIRRLALAAVLALACSKKQDAPPRPKPGTRIDVGAMPPDLAANPELVDLAKRANAEVPRIQALMKRGLTSEDIDRYLVIEAELAPHKSGLSDPAAAAAYQKLAEPICQKHGLSGCLEHNTIDARLTAAKMHLRYNTPDAKLDDVQKADREAVKGRLQDLTGKR